MSRTTRPYGPSAFLVEAASTEEVAALVLLTVPGVRQVIPGARSVVVECVDPAALPTAIDAYAMTPLTTTGGAAAAGLVEIPVTYDGPDLAKVAAAMHGTEADVIAAHTAPTYEVAFCGFTAGFAYLRGLPAELHVPRRASPRQRVDPGSVGIAGEWTGVYPRATPGGWNLLGRTEAVMWDPLRPDPALLTHPMRVRFVAL